MAEDGFADKVLTTYLENYYRRSLDPKMTTNPKYKTVKDYIEFELPIFRE